MMTIECHLVGIGLESLLQHTLNDALVPADHYSHSALPDGDGCASCACKQLRQVWTTPRDG